MPPLFAVWDWNHFLMAVLAAAVFGLLGIALLLVGFKAFERVTPKVDIEAELAKGNIAVGIAVGALLLAISLILMVSISG